MEAFEPGTNADPDVVNRTCVNNSRLIHKAVCSMACFGGSINEYYGENRTENTLPSLWFSIFTFFDSEEILSTVGMVL
jgi:hypothetical protein